MRRKNSRAHPGLSPSDSKEWDIASKWDSASEWDSASGLSFGAAGCLHQFDSRIVNSN